MNIRRSTITPTMGIALLALFFALGGSAFAVGERIDRASVAQQRCSNGAVRGIAYVTGNPTMGIANIGDKFTSAGVVFGRKFNCNGRATQVRRTSLGVFEIRFVGNPASVRGRDWDRQRVRGRRPAAGRSLPGCRTSSRS